MDTVGLTKERHGTDYLPPAARRCGATGGGQGARCGCCPASGCEDYVDVADRLAQTFGASDCRVRTIRNPHRVQLWFLVNDPLSRRRAVRRRRTCLAAGYPGGAGRGRHVVAAAAARQPCAVVGATGAGKSGVLWCDHRRPGRLHPLGGLVKVWAVDPKGGMELAFGRPLFDRFAYGNTNAAGGYEAGLAQLLEDAVEVMRRRADRLMGVTRLHTPTTAEPLIVVLVDELAALTGWITDRTMKKRIDSALVAAAHPRPRGRRRRGRRDPGPAQGRDPATRPVPHPDRAAGQRSRTRPPLPRLRGRTTAARRASMIPDTLPGVGYVAQDGIPDPVRVRFAWHTDTDIHQLTHPVDRWAGAHRDRGRSSMTKPDFTITADVARELAASAQVCGRPMLRRVHDRQTGSEDIKPIPCGSTRESVCPACARKARIIRMQQCAEGWHLTDEPERGRPDQLDDDQDHDDQDDDEAGSKRVRSTRRRQDVPDLPRMTVDPRTVGHVFTAAGSGKQYRPSMFLTLTLPSYGAVLANGAPRNPAHYDYRRAALDALHFSKLCGRLWANLRRCAGYNVQYFSAIEAQRRLAPHLHAAARGAIPRAILRQVVEATYYTLWWPPFDQPVYVDRLPVWTGPEHGYADPDTGEILPTWDQALDRLDNDPDAKPAHVMRFGKQLDLQGVIPEQADQAVRYLTKYLTKAIGETYADDDRPGLPAARRPAARRTALAALLPPLRELAALRRPTRPRQPGPDPRPVPAESPRPGQPRPRPPRPHLPALVRQDRRTAQGRPR